MKRRKDFSKVSMEIGLQINKEEIIYDYISPRKCRDVSQFSDWQ